MNKGRIIILLALLLVYNCVFSQNPNRPKIYERTIFIDNIEIGTLDKWEYHNIATSLKEYYLSFVDFQNKTILKNNIRGTYQERDNMLDTRNNKMFFISKKAKDGYLESNEHLMLWLNEHSEDINQQDKKIEYRIDSVPVINPKQVSQLLKLRKKNIASIDVSQHNEATITVNIIRKNFQ